MLYSISDGMKPVETESKNNLEPGTVLTLNSHNGKEYVITKNMGINANSEGYGTAYLVIDTNSLRQSKMHAYELKFIADKKDNRIQTYIMNKKKTAEEVQNLLHISEERRVIKEERQNLANIRRNADIKKGKQLFEKHIPETAKSLIVARYEVDDTDLMTDYFATHTTSMVILGYSTHTKDLFSEMRKHADKIEETRHLVTAADVNRNGDPRTEINKSYWYPVDEHREKYSMGAGYYLKASSHYSNGWTIAKAKKYSLEWQDDFYISMAKRCIFES